MRWADGLGAKTKDLQQIYSKYTKQNLDLQVFSAKKNKPETCPTATGVRDLTSKKDREACPEIRLLGDLHAGKMTYNRTIIIKLFEIRSIFKINRKKINQKAVRPRRNFSMQKNRVFSLNVRKLQKNWSPTWLNKWLMSKVVQGDKISSIVKFSCVDETSKKGQTTTKISCVTENSLLLKSVQNSGNLSLPCGNEQITK